MNGVQLDRPLLDGVVEDVCEDLDEEDPLQEGLPPLVGDAVLLDSIPLSSVLNL